MTVLVVGVGSELRADDRVGREVADRIGALALPGVTVRSVTQLMPELALDLAAAEVAVFVDGSTEVAEVTVTGITAPGTPPADHGVSHHATPASLLGLTASVAGRAPSVAYVVAVPVSDLGFGEALSPAAAAAAARAEEVVLALLARHGGAAPPPGPLPDEASGGT